MKSSSPDENFVRHLTGAQPRLLYFIMSLLPDYEAAQDVLQDTNVILWRKFDQYEADTSFMAWACQVARYEVLAWVRDRKRDRLLFDENEILEISADSIRRVESTSRLGVFLEQCLETIDDRERDLVRQRYATGGTVKAMAAELNEPAGRISVTLCRIRKRLMDCIERKIAAEGA